MLDYKQNEDLYRLPFRDALGASGLVPTSNRQIPTLTRQQNRFVRPLIRGAFHLQRKMMYKTKDQGAWAGRDEFLRISRQRSLHQTEWPAIYGLVLVHIVTTELQGATHGPFVE